MLRGITQIILYSIVVNVEDHLPDLVIVVRLPRRIQDKRAVVNVVGTGEDCFKWAVLAGMHPVDKCNRNPNRMSRYVEHVGKYDFSSLCIPVALSSIGSFATKNALSINVYTV